MCPQRSALPLTRQRRRYYIHICTLMCPQRSALSLTRQHRRYYTYMYPDVSSKISVAPYQTAQTLLHTYMYPDVSSEISVVPYQTARTFLHIYVPWCVLRDQRCPLPDITDVITLICAAWSLGTFMHLHCFYVCVSGCFLFLNFKVLLFSYCRQF